MILFVGTMVDQYASADFAIVMHLNSISSHKLSLKCTGTMTFENTSSTRWHVNVDIPEMKATLEKYCCDVKFSQSNFPDCTRCLTITCYDHIESEIYLTKSNCEILNYQ